MSSVEGIWLLRTNEVGAENQLLSPSVITLETGRLFGGDSAYFYVGDYTVEGGVITGSALVRTHTWHDELENVFGMKGPIEHTVNFSGQISDDVLEGAMETSAVPGLELVWKMAKLAELP
ncbi:MAG: hypothetical protein Q27BB25_09685 [Blastomonas sp. CACIA14H2]|uniref:GrlR family regulatory protein n=1 Tax=Blastomonas sp. CACIA14H2 TaxID=1419876 RepID=UPI0003CFF9A3|nr:MAG: hypothetical protein Q27BB25_09685 [Blastomonas sp. CACIA14H2]